MLLRTVIVCLLLLALVGCASQQPAPVCPKLPPAPAAVMQPQEGGFLDRLEALLSKP